MEKMVVLAVALVGAALSQVPAVLSGELIINDRDAHLGDFKFEGFISLNLSLRDSTIVLEVVDVRTKIREAYNASLNSRPDDFCGKFQPFALAVVALLIIIPVVVLAVYAQIKNAKDDRLLGEALRNLPGMPREFRYGELNQATANFAEENKLGEGAFGKVYWGMLPSSEEEIAVKSFSRETSRADFLSELTIINRLHHKNLVRLLGWCYKNKKLLLVYVYMPNGSLDKHLYPNDNDGEVLSWERRYHVLRGVASALHYLHNENEQKVIHRDIKSSNVMLDAGFNACLGDFGLAKAIDVENTSYVELSSVPGTWGYIAPECFHTGKATGKSDVFGFGAFVLEVVCGRRPGTPIGGFRLLVDWVWTMYEEGNLLDTVDLRLHASYDHQEAKRLLFLGLACCHPTAGERPKMQTIVEILSKTQPPPQVPLPKPAFVMPSFMERDSFESIDINGTDFFTPVNTDPLFWPRRSSTPHNSEPFSEKLQSGDNAPEKKG